MKIIDIITMLHSTVSQINFHGFCELLSQSARNFNVIMPLYTARGFYVRNRKTLLYRKLYAWESIREKDQIYLHPPVLVVTSFEENTANLHELVCRLTGKRDLNRADIETTSLAGQTTAEVVGVINTRAFSSFGDRYLWLDNDISVLKIRDQKAKKSLTARLKDIISLSETCIYQKINLT